jgi:hypothetical protein
MTYSYGCSPIGLGKMKSDIYVYRITRTSEDGSVLDMPWTQVKARCHELGVKHVPEINLPMWASSIKWAMENYNLEELANTNNPWKDEHISEGLCIRIEYEDSTRPHIYKYKTWDFKVLENMVKDQPDYIDTEEIN